jgi:Holliday junction resolvase RusA-like endonuclease
MRRVWETNAVALEAGLPAGPIRLTVLGEPASKANSRKLVTNPHTKRPMFIKSAKARAYVESVGHQVPKIDPLLTGPLVFTATIYYASERPDLDESLILDALQKRIYANDRQVREKHIFHAIDRNNPRAEIVIELRQGALFGAVAGEAA